MTGMLKEPFGEVIKSRLDLYTVQAWEWNQYPTIGSCVCIQESPRTLCIVATCETTSLDANRVPRAYKKNIAELKAEHPHLFSLLHTTITCIPLLMLHDRPTIPNRPTTLHSFCSPCTIDELHALIACPGYIKRIMQLSEPLSADQLISHHLHYLQQAGILSKEILRKLVVTYMSAIGSDYKRISRFNETLCSLNL